MKKTIAKFLEQNQLARQIIRSRRKRIVFTATVSLAINLIYALYNTVLGFVTYSWWFITVGAYYVILSVMRFLAVVSDRQYKKKQEVSEYFIMRFSGIMFLLLSIILIGTVYLTLRYDIAVKYHEIVMITIATYAFTKVTLAIIKVIKIRKSNSPLLYAIRNISCADAAVSIFSLQRSMLVSFGGMSQGDIRIFNMLTGAGVCLVVIILGINMIIKSYREREIKKCQNQN